MTPSAAANQHTSHESPIRTGRKPLRLVWSRRGGRTSAAELCEGHGIALYLLAYVLTGRIDVAHFLVAQAIRDHSTQPGRVARGESPDVRFELARRVYHGWHQITGATAPPLPTEHKSRADPSLPEPIAQIGALSTQQRETIALCVYGGHSYRDAADLLGVPAAHVANLLGLGLHELASQRNPHVVDLPDVR